MRTRPDPKIEDALDEALAETFPASDPVALLQPTAIGEPEKDPAPKLQKSGEIETPRINSSSHTAT